MRQEPGEGKLEMRWRNLDKLSLVQRLKGPTGRLTTHSSSEINCAVSRRTSAGASAAFIAEQIGVGRSTIYREWRHCGGRGRFNAPLMRVKARAAGGQQRPMLRGGGVEPGGSPAASDLLSRPHRGAQSSAGTCRANRAPSSSRIYE